MRQAPTAAVTFTGCISSNVFCLLDQNAQRKCSRMVCAWCCVAHRDWLLVSCVAYVAHRPKHRLWYVRNSIDLSPYYRTWYVFLTLLWSMKWKERTCTRGCWVSHVPGIIRAYSGFRIVTLRLLFLFLVSLGDRPENVYTCGVLTYLTVVV